jgi:hypothetical protein
VSVGGHAALKTWCLVLVADNGGLVLAFGDGLLETVSHAMRRLDLMASNGCHSETRRRESCHLHLLAGGEGSTGEARRTALRSSRPAGAGRVPRVRRRPCGPQVALLAIPG